MSINNLTIKTILEKTVPYLAEKNIPNPKLEADLMLAAILDLPRVKLYSQWDRPLEPAEVQGYREIILKRIQGWPLAYLTGKKFFLSWEFAVSPSVLIPRPETEILVEAVFEKLKYKNDVTGADIGVGSGAIVISLAKLLTESIWYGIDLSAEAMEIAGQNAIQLEVASQITYLQGDLLEPLLQRSLQLDVIVSNPPYIPNPEIISLQKEVLREPVLALDGGYDGLDIYRRLIPQAVACLKPGGLLAVEHGYNQRNDLAALFEKSGFICEFLSDLAGIDRIIIGMKSH